MRASFEPLRRHRYINLTTFRKNGEPVPTTVWFTLYDGRIYVTTPRDTGKMKRIRNDPRVVLAPGNAWGREKGESVEGVARPVTEGEFPPEAEEALRRKYRGWLVLFRLFGQQKYGPVTLEIQPAE